MKSYLLDTHIFINAFTNPTRNSRKVARIIDSDSPKFISAITLVEIAQLAESKPKELRLNNTLATFINQALSDLQVQVLAITAEHAQRFFEIQLAKDHRDQFDRIIIAQGASTGFVVISDDRKFSQYSITVFTNFD